MNSYAKNLSNIAGATIGAKLIAAASGLKQLAFMPASTIQLLGAEKALFRHLRNKRINGPKYGHIYQHPLVKKTPAKHKGKVARSLAAKLSLAARADYFKAKEDVSGKMQKDLQDRIEKLSK